MLCIPQTGLNKRQLKKSLIAFAFLFFFVAVSMLTEAYILTHASHVHDNNGGDGSCAVCIQVQSAKIRLKEFCTVIVCGAFMLAGFFAVIVVIRPDPSGITLLTPISLKNRMNN